MGAVKLVSSSQFRLRAKSIENDQKPVPIDDKNKINSKVYVDKNTEDLYGGTTEDEGNKEFCQFSQKY